MSVVTEGNAGGATPQDLDELLQHEKWLRGELAESAKRYLKTLERLQALNPDSDEYATLDGELYAQAAQVEMDASDIVKVADDILDALPDEDED
jgi:DNA-binding IclR family transcriptional regulator